MIVSNRINLAQKAKKRDEKIITELGEIQFYQLDGPQVSFFLEQLAELRITIFYDYPYLYEGSLEYEKEYLKVYTQSSRSAVFLAVFNDQIIGAASCLPLTDEHLELQKPFLENEIDLKDYFYFGESLLEKKFRGYGIGHLFFQFREQHALSFKEVKYTCFCAVERSIDHPLRPIGYQPLDGFWHKRGYEKSNQLIASYRWVDRCENEETSKKMIFWLKNWQKKASDKI